MNPWTEGDLFTNGIRLHYYRTGGSGKPLVLAHGITDDGLCWTPVAEALSPKYDLILVDARGHGKSEAPDRGYDQTTMARDLAGLIIGLGLVKPVVLGHSMGASTALHLGGLFPNLPGALILEDPHMFWEVRKPSPVNEVMLADFQARILENKRKTRSELLEDCRQDNPSWSERELDPWADSKQRFSHKILEMFQTPPATREEVEDLLRKITCPVLLISADQEKGAIVGEEQVISLRALVPQLQHAHIPGAGHNIRREQFTSYLSIMKKYLGELGN